MTDNREDPINVTECFREESIQKRIIEAALHIIRCLSGYESKRLSEKPVYHMNVGEYVHKSGRSIENI